LDDVDDRYNLRRFVDAQDPVFEQVCGELRAGQKASHWMWFIFPQIAGLGRSPFAVEYAIASLKEALAYLNHPVLGPRLKEFTQLVNAVNGKTIDQILGAIDGVKFRSSMTLFAATAKDSTEFNDAIEKYFSGDRDPLTLERL
jgi:uncharacterized protein (DUF1810 family)